MVFVHFVVAQAPAITGVGGVRALDARNRIFRPRNGAIIDG